MRLVGMAWIGVVMLPLTVGASSPAPTAISHPEPTSDPQPVGPSDFEPSASEAASLIEVLKHDPLERARVTAVRRLGAMPTPSADVVGALRRSAVRDPSGLVRGAAREILAKRGSHYLRPSPPVLAMAWEDAPSAPSGVEVVPLLHLDFLPSEASAEKPSPVRQVSEVVVAPQPAAPPVVQLPPPSTAPAQSPALSRDAIEQTLRAKESMAVAAKSPSVPTPTAAPVKPAETPATAPQDLHQLPRTPEGRKQLADSMMARIREHINRGELDEADSLLYRVRELAVDFGRLEEKPADLERELLNARRKLKGNVLPSIWTQP